MRAACFRLTGIYGPNQFGGEDHGWVANFAIRAVLGLPITVFGTGKQLRDILYASDAAAAFESFYRSPEPGIYNLGGGRDSMISLLETIKVIGELTGAKPEVSFGPERFGDLRYFVADYQKFNQATGWNPKVKPQEGISRLVKWIQKSADLFVPAHTLVA
jgi:CDP-paratose 2-epimerase